MQTHFDLAALPRFRNAVVTIGSFDGVHAGHRQLFEGIQRLAHRHHGESVVITFDPHPRSVLRPNLPTKLLTTREEKIRYCAACGVDHLVIVPFTREFSEQTPKEYVQQFLVRHFSPTAIVIGYDHRFGKDRAGDLQFLRSYAQLYRYEVVEIGAQEIDDLAVSSTRIRKCLRAGEVREAGELLGRPYALTGTVERGKQIGRTIGFPTANIRVDEPAKLIPALGIYAVRAILGEERLDGMLYIGDRPSLQDGRGVTIELNLFDFDRDLYGQELTVEFVAFLRGDMTLDGLDALRVQLEHDEISARSVLSGRQLTGAARDYRPATAVVILNYNGRNYLEEYLQGVIDTLPDYARVIVADNLSTDDSVAWMKAHHPTVELIELPENYGFANGYNMAMQRVEAEIYVLLNSDVRVTEGWVESIIPHFHGGNVGAVQPKVRAVAEPDKFEYAGASGGYLDALGYPFCRGRIFQHTEKDEGQYDTVDEIFWATGAAFFCRADLFHQLGGFEPEYFAHAEEIDLCWRMKRAGYRILVEPASVVYHVGGGTLSYNTPRKTYLNFRNTLTTSFKNEPVSRLIWWIPVRLVLDGMAGGLFLFQRKFSHIKAIVQAHFHFYRHVGLWRKRRKQRREQIEAARIGPDRSETGRIPDSIILHHYLLGNDRYSEVERERVTTTVVETV